MEYEGKEKRVYHGIAIPFICMIAVPTACFFLFYYVIEYFGQYKQDALIAMCLGFAALIGFLFGMICLISGFIHDLFLSMIDRIKDTLEFFRPFSKDAFKWYFYQFKQDGGPIIWIFLLLILLMAITSVVSFITFFHLYFG